MKTIVAAAVGLHGLGMVGGVYLVFTTRSWLARVSPGGIVLAGFVATLWAASGLLLVGGAWGYYSGAEWFRAWLLAGAAISLAGIILWAGRIPPGTYVGALLDVAVIVWLLFFPPSAA
ncbi:MAG: hypothetical protein IBX62_00845 [Coriobacteriia bacterium]|nr:hypothetical protein [Coriobacteriia bacterium]